MAIDVEAWYKKYGPMVIRRCRALLRNEDEAMDAVQDVFVNLLRSKERLHFAFPSSLLYSMATNVCLNRLRRKKLKALEIMTSGEGLFSGAASGSADGSADGFDQVDAEMLVGFILEDESEETRTILFMYHVDGMTLREIGETVGLSVSGVRKRLETFRKRARLKLGDV